MEIANVTINEITNEINITTSPVVVGIQGKSAFQVWQEDNPGGTKEDYKLDLTQKNSFRIVNGHLILTIG